MHGTANRELADEDGLWLWLCHFHHTGSNESAHKNSFMNLQFKKLAQTKYEEHIGTREQFIERYGKSYL